MYFSGVKMLKNTRVTSYFYVPVGLGVVKKEQTGILNKIIHSRQLSSSPSDKRITNLSELFSKSSSSSWSHFCSGFLRTSHGGDVIYDPAVS